jgi:hypothetical protein
LFAQIGPSDAKRLPASDQIFAIPTRLSRLACRRKRLRGRQRPCWLAWLAVRSAYVVVAIDLFVSVFRRKLFRRKLYRKTTLPGSPPPASSCRQGLALPVEYGRPDSQSAGRSAGLLHFRVCRSVAVSHRFGTARTAGGVPTLRPCERPIRGSDPPAAHAGLCLFNRVRREKTVPP